MSLRSFFSPHTRRPRLRATLPWTALALVGVLVASGVSVAVSRLPLQERGLQAEGRANAIEEVTPQPTPAARPRAARAIAKPRRARVRRSARPIRSAADSAPSDATERALAVTVPTNREQRPPPDRRVARSVDSQRRVVTPAPSPVRPQVAETELRARERQAVPERARERRKHDAERARERKQQDAERGREAREQHDGERREEPDEDD